MNRLKKRIMVFVFVSMLAFSPSARAQADMFEGQPTFSQGSELGYYVWREGDKWKVRRTTMGPQRKFTGSVVATGGKLHDLKRIDVEEERRVLLPRPAAQRLGWPSRSNCLRSTTTGARPPSTCVDHIEKQGDHTIVFAALTGNDIDGFNFKPDKKSDLASIRARDKRQARAATRRDRQGESEARAIPLEVQLP